MRRPRMGASTLAAAANFGSPRARLAFTMAEVLFAIIILGLGLILLAASFPVGIAQSQKAEEATAAGLIAQQAIDQITKVVAANARPAYGVGGWASTPLVAPVDGYAARPVTMGLLDGAMVSDSPDAVRTPDLRVKLLYPNWSPALHPNTPANPTLSDGRPQNPTLLHTTTFPQLGAAVENDVSVPPVPATFLNVWGFRSELVGGTTVWQENLKWAYPADRRYYWYAFYRQMYEDPTGYPNPANPATPWTARPEQVAAVRSDHITRRTYRVWIVAAKIPSGSPSILEPGRMKTPEAYADQWLAIAPIRVPAADGTTNVLIAPGNNWLQDVAPNNYIATGIQQGKIKRGGIVVDAWGEVYRVLDLSTDAVRLDRAPQIPAGGIDSLLPFWFNPNAIAVFPTIVVKQADLP